MGEVVAGLALGPSLLGALFPAVRTALFPDDIIPFIGVVAQLGLVFYMFLVGLELDANQLSGRARQVVAISNASVALPMLLGILIAVPPTSCWARTRGSRRSRCSWGSRCR